MPREFCIGAGWKMNKTIAETETYLHELVTTSLPPDVMIFVAPPFTALAAAKRAIGDAPVHLAAQNMHWADAGAYTGEISPAMLLDCGVEIVELGHSERRAHQAETDVTINAKVHAAIAHRLRPLVCVGEHEYELKAGASVETVSRQVKLAFAGLDPEQLGGAIVAYEPIWAIGETGQVAPPAHVSAVLGALREMLDARGLPWIPVLYGGSVGPDNAPDLIAIPAVDGLFVGRAAWSAEGFAKVIEAGVAGRLVRPSSGNETQPKPSSGLRNASRI